MARKSQPRKGRKIHRVRLNLSPLWGSDPRQRLTPLAPGATLCRRSAAKERIALDTVFELFEHETDAVKTRPALKSVASA